MQGPPGGDHGDSSPLPASVAGDNSGRLAQCGPGLPGPWVTGHLKREGEEKNRQRGNQGTSHMLRNCTAGLGHTALPLPSRNEGVLSNIVCENVL